MRRLHSLMILLLGLAAGAAATYGYVHLSASVAPPAAAEQSPPPGRKILYYRNPMGLPETPPGHNDRGMRCRVPEL